MVGEIKTDRTCFKKLAMGITCSLMLISGTLYSQNEKLEWKIDTLQQFTDTFLVNIEVCQDTDLIETARALLYQVDFESPTLCLFRLCILGNVFNKQVSAYRLVYHGERKYYSKQRYMMLEVYDYGALISTAYFDPDQRPIEKHEYIGNHPTCSQYRTTHSIYLVKGRQKLDESPYQNCHYKMSS